MYIFTLLVNKIMNVMVYIKFNRKVLCIMYIFTLLVNKIMNVMVYIKFNRKVLCIKAFLYRLQTF
jgi:hypothetical protein